MKDLVGRILLLICKNNITASKLINDCGLSQSAISEWKKDKAKPSLDAVAKIADYFGVSIDYLLGRENKSTDLSQDERQLLTYFKQCDVIDQTYLLERAKVMANNNREVYKDNDKWKSTLKNAK